MTSGPREILLRYHEIATKGDNRAWFEERLAINARKLLQKTLGKSAQVETHRIHGRILLNTDWNSEVQEILQRRLFGLSSFSPMVRVPTDLEQICKQALEEFKQHVAVHGLPHRFQVRTRRSDKALPQTSMEIDRIVGSVIKNEFPSLIVDLRNPDFTLGIEIRHRESFIWTEKIKGQGGLPVGIGAPVLSLISGGLDSPVATIQILKRGSLCHLLHFYGAPFVGDEVLDKIRDLAKIINLYQPDPQPLHVVHFGKIQEKIALATHPKMRTLLYRRMMVRISNAFAKKIGAMGLVTGESLGQVASQTLENLGNVDTVTELPILRPLIGHDKDEIIDLAKKWGTFETSIRPATDCCTLFADRHPTLRSKLHLIEEQEKCFPVSEYVQEGLENMTREIITRG